MSVKGAHMEDITHISRGFDAELRVGIENHSASMGAELYLGYEMRAMRCKENNDSQRERPMNETKGK